MSDRANELIVMLAEKFPACFAVYEMRRQPLKIKIHLDILAAMEIEPADLSTALRIYCSNTFYLKTCSLAGAVRVDLAGEAAGVVSEAEAANAVKALARRLAKNKERAIAAEWEAAWARRRTSAPKPAPSIQPEPVSVPERTESPEQKPARRGDGFNALRESARLRRAAAAQQQQ